MRLIRYTLWRIWEAAGRREVRRRNGGEGLTVPLSLVCNVLARALQPSIRVISWTRVLVSGVGVWALRS